MSKVNESERMLSQVFLQIKKWLFMSYVEYRPKVETQDTFSIEYNEYDSLYKLYIQICEITSIIRYYVELPYSIDTKQHDILLERINVYHLKACIGRFDLDKQKGILIYNFWNSYDSEKLDLNLIDRGMGITMICCKERFGLFEKGNRTHEQNNFDVRWTYDENSSTHFIKVN